MEITNSERLKELKEVFDIFDSNNDGVIETAELKNILRLDINQQMNRIVYELIEEQHDNNHTLDFQEFVNIMTGSIHSHKGENDLYHIIRIFKLFDVNNNGYITADDLRQVILLTGEDISLYEQEQMIKQADIDQDGAISLEEFITIMKTPLHDEFQSNVNY